MKPEFPAFGNAVKLVRKFFDFGLMGQFASLMDGDRIINNEGLAPLNEKVESAYHAIRLADEEGLRISQQANELTQHFYYDKIKDFGKITSFSEYSHSFIEDGVTAFNLQYPDRKIDIKSLVLYRLYLDGLVSDLKRLYNFYSSYYEKKFEKHALDSSPANHYKKEKKQLPQAKIKIRLTVSQIIYLFDLLQHSRLIENKTRKQIAEFISNNFYNEASEDLNSKHIQNSTNEVSRIDAMKLNSFLSVMAKKIKIDYK